MKTLVSRYSKMLCESDWRVIFVFVSILMIAIYTVFPDSSRLKDDVSEVTHGCLNILFLKTFVFDKMCVASRLVSRGIPI